MAAVPLLLGPPDPLLASLRALPLVGRLMPPPQVPHIGAVAVYWVRLQVTLHSACSTCYEAVLLDAAQT